MRMGGGAKPFGVDAARVPALVRRILDARRRMARLPHLRRLAGARCRRPDRRADAPRSRSPPSLPTQIGATPPLVNLGGGFGIPYFHGEQPLDVEAVGDGACAETSAQPARPILADTGFAIELGRWLVGEAGVYLTRIVDRKVSHGKTFLVTDGGMQHQLAASGNFGQVVRRNYPVAIASRFGAEPRGGGRASSAASAPRSTGSPMTS